MDKPIVSIIIPCYNHGKYIDEAVDSVLKQTFQTFEIIIINDGSNDEFTNKKLENYSRPNTQVITTANQGLSLARNTGIKMAQGKYILPLDADDKIHPEYLSKAINIIDSSENIGIVYAKTEFIDALTGVWDLPLFSFPEILLKNSIVCTSFFRKSDWTKVGGYNKNMIYGYEDLDFWLSIIELGRETVFIPEVMFYYRKKFNELKQKYSILDANSSLEKISYTFSTLVRNHPKLYSDNAEFLVNKFYDMEFQKEDMRRIVVERDMLIIDLQKEILEKENKIKNNMVKLKDAEQQLKSKDDLIKYLDKRTLKKLPSSILTKIKKSISSSN